MTSSWPDLTALPGVAAAVEAARDAVAALGLHPVNRRGWPASAAAAAIRGARASAVMDGGSSAVAAEQAGGNITDPVLAGAVRSHAAIAGLAGTFGRAPLQAIARLHTLAAADLVDPVWLGRPVGGPDVARRLAGIAQLVTASGWPAPVVVALVHAVIAVIQPFEAGNGVGARAAGWLAMVYSGLDPHALAAPEVAFLRSGNRYRELLDDYAMGSQTAVGEWLRFVCQALQAGAQEGRSIADAAAQ